VILTFEIAGRVLPGRHAACILVEHVEKPTDNRPARLLCYVTARLGNAKGTEVACGCHHRAQPHAESITHGRSGIPWAEKWPSIGISLECRNPDIRAESARSPKIDSLGTSARADLFR